MAGAGAGAGGARPTRASRRLASASSGDQEGSPLKSLPLTTRRIARNRRAVAKTQDASNDNDIVLQSREETESRSASPPTQQRPLRRSNRTVSRSVSPSLNAPPTTKARQPSAKASAASTRKVAEPRNTTTRRKKAAVTTELPAITESPIKSPPGAFPIESPARSAHHTSGIALTPAHLSTATKRGYSSSTDRSVEPSNLSLFKRSRTDDWTPSKQLHGFAYTETSPVAVESATANNANAHSNTSSQSDLASASNNSIDAEVSAVSTHSSPASDDAPTPVPHGLFARVKSFLPSMSARASRIQTQEAPAITSPTPVTNSKSFLSPLGSAKSSTAPAQAGELALPSTTPSNATSARHASVPDSSSPDFLSVKRSGFRYTPKHAIPVNNDDDGYESDELREVINQAQSKPAQSRTENRAYIRKLEKDVAEKKAAEAKKVPYSPNHDGLVLAMMAPVTKRVRGRVVAPAAKSGSGSMISSSVRSHSDIATSAVVSVSAPSISHSVKSSASQAVGPLVGASNELTTVPTAALEVPADAPNVDDDSFIIPAATINNGILVTDLKLVDTVRALVAYSSSNPDAEIPDPEQMVALLDQHNQTVGNAKKASISEYNNSVVMEDVSITSSPDAHDPPEHGHVYSKDGSSSDSAEESEFTMRGALVDEPTDDADLSWNADSSPFVSTPRDRPSSQETPLENNGSPLKRLFSTAKSIMASPFAMVFNGSPQVTAVLKPIEASPSRRQKLKSRPATKSSSRATPFGSPIKQSEAPRSALRSSRPGDIHKSQRQAKRVNWEMEKKQDNKSFDSSSAQNSNGKRPVKGTYSADFSDSEDSDDTSTQASPSKDSTKEKAKARDNQSLEPSSTQRTILKPVKPRVKGTYTADFSDSDDSDDENFDNMSDIKLRKWYVGIDKFDLPFIAGLEETHPRAAARLRKMREHRIREEQMEEEMKKEKLAGKTPSATTRGKYLAGALKSQQSIPAFGAMSPLSERSESSPQKETETVDAQSTPLSSSKVETLSTTSNQSPLKERAWPQTPAPVTPYKKSYTPNVSSGLRNVTIASPIHVVASPFTAADAAPDPNFLALEKIFLDIAAKSIAARPSAADKLWNQAVPI